MIENTMGTMLHYENKKRVLIVVMHLNRETNYEEVKELFEQQELEDADGLMSKIICTAPSIALTLKIYVESGNAVVTHVNGMSVFDMAKTPLFV